MRYTLSKRERIADQFSCTLDVAQLTKYERRVAAAARAGIVAGIDVGQMMIAFALVERLAFFGVSPRVHEFPGKAERTPIQVMGLDKPVMFAHLLGQCLDALRIAACVCQVARDVMVLAFAPQRHEEPSNVVVLLGEVGSLREARRDLTAAKSPCRHKPNAKCV